MLMGYDYTWIMVLPENWESGKWWTQMLISWERGRSFYTYRCGEKLIWSLWISRKMLYPSLMQVLLLALGELFVPGSEWEESAHSVVSGHLCSELLPAESMGLMLLWKQHWSWLLLIRWWYRNQGEVTFCLLTQHRMAVTFCSLPFFYHCFSLSLQLYSALWQPVHFRQIKHYFYFNQVKFLYWLLGFKCYRSLHES